MTEINCYIEVSVKDRLPDEDGWYTVILRNGSSTQIRFTTSPFRLREEDEWQQWYYTSDNDITHWLKKQENVIICTKEELDDFSLCASYHGYSFAKGEDVEPPNFKNYLKSKE